MILFFRLQFLTVPEQVDAQSKLLERWTRDGVDVPAFLHDLVYLTEMEVKGRGKQKKVSVFIYLLFYFFFINVLGPFDTEVYMLSTLFTEMSF